MIVLVSTREGKGHTRGTRQRKTAVDAGRRWKTSPHVNRCSRWPSAGHETPRIRRRRSELEMLWLGWIWTVGQLRSSPLRPTRHDASISTTTSSSWAGRRRRMRRRSSTPAMGRPLLRTTRPTTACCVRSAVAASAASPCSPAAGEHFVGSPPAPAESATTPRLRSCSRTSSNSSYALLVEITLVEACAVCRTDDGHRALVARIDRGGRREWCCTAFRFL
jgi:hypothetical protein